MNRKSRVQNRLFTIQVIVAITTYVFFNLLKTTYAQEANPAKGKYELYKKAMQKYHNDEFDEAIRLATLLQEQYPDDPAGSLALLSSYQAIMFTYRVRLFESKFDSLVDLSVELSRKAIRRDKKNSENYFYLGSALGFRALLNAKRKNWMIAFKDGALVSKSFEKAIAYNPQFYDSYYGLGLFNYWIGAKAKALAFLPFVKGKQKGIEQMEIAREKADFVVTHATYALIAAYYNEGNFEKSLSLADELYEKYPDNATLNYWKGRIYIALHQWLEAKQTFEHLYEILKNAKYQSISYHIECLYQLAKCQFILKNYLEAQALCQNALALEPRCDFSKELNGPIEKFSETMNELRDLNKKVRSPVLKEISTSN